MSTDGGRPVCVVGAGVSGLLAVRRLVEQGLPVEVVERRADVGGLWNRHPRYGGVYRSAHLISSKLRTALPDFPMPADYPDYPHHRQVLSYLEHFADRHDLRRHIRFGRQIDRAQPMPAGGWRITLDNGDQRDYAALVIANGHHWDPVTPDVATSSFDGVTLHSAAYHTPEIFADRRVVVVGFGNTACDVAVDAVYAGAEVTLSVRSGNQLIPKYVFGRPVDQLGGGGGGGASRITSRLPRSWRTALEDRVIRTLAGAPERFGLPSPRHRLYERQPLVNSLLPYHLGHGDIRVRPPVTRLRDSTVVFADGGEEKADVVVWCTGYRVSLPFLNVRADLNGDERGRPGLWLNMFHPRRDDVVAVGMVDAFGSFGTLDLQAELAARHLRGVLGATGSPLRSLIGSVSPPTGNADRDWLFKDRAYTALLAEQVARLRAEAR